MDVNYYISGLQQGNRKIISEIYEQNLPQITHWILKNNGSKDDALDIFQEAIEVIIQKIYNKKLPEKLNFGGYLYTICKNKWRDKLNGNKKQEEVRNEELLRYTHEEADIVDLDKEDQGENLRLMLKDTFDELSAVCQQLVGLLESGLSPADVAIRMEMTNANTVYRRKFACYESWKKKIEAHRYYSLWKYN